MAWSFAASNRRRPRRDQAAGTYPGIGFAPPVVVCAGASGSTNTLVMAPCNRSDAARQCASRTAAWRDQKGVIIVSPIRMAQPCCSFATLKTITADLLGIRVPWQGGVVSATWWPGSLLGLRITLGIRGSADTDSETTCMAGHPPEHSWRPHRDGHRRQRASAAHRPFGATQRRRRANPMAGWIKARKLFFFRKKRQKTRVHQLRGGRPERRPARNVFLLFFFRKRSPYSPLHAMSSFRLCRATNPAPKLPSPCPKE